jgi:hypothetical protein
MNVAQRDREMFQIPIETRMRMSVRQKRSWLDRVTPHVNEAERRFRERSARGQMDILEMWDKQKERNEKDGTEITERLTNQTGEQQSNTRNNQASELDEESSNSSEENSIVQDLTTKEPKSTQTTVLDEDASTSSSTSSATQEATKKNPTKKPDAAAWGSLKPHKTPKEDKQEGSKKKKQSKEKQNEQQANEKSIPPKRRMATDTVCRGRLPKFKNYSESAESNSNPDEETVMNRSGSLSRRYQRGRSARQELKTILQYIFRTPTIDVLFEI